MISYLTDKNETYLKRTGKFFLKILQNRITLMTGYIVILQWENLE